MFPIVWRAKTEPCLLALFLVTFFALVWLLLCCVLGSWGGAAVSVVVPLPFVLWWKWCRERSVAFFPDHLEDRTWFSVHTVSYAGARAELRTRRARSGKGLSLNGHLPLLTLRREGRTVAAISQSLRPEEELLRQTLVLLRNDGVPVKRLF